MSGHTPGPWKASAAKEGKHAPAWWICGDARFVAKAYGHDDMPAEANARLIAAAPDLLEALRPFATLDIDMSLKVVLGTGFCRLVQDARDAIAKAGG